MISKVLRSYSPEVKHVSSQDGYNDYEAEDNRDDDI